MGNGVRSSITLTQEVEGEKKYEGKFRRSFFKKRRVRERDLHFLRHSTLFLFLFSSSSLVRCCFAGSQWRLALARSHCVLKTSINISIAQHSTQERRRRKRGSVELGVRLHPYHDVCIFMYQQTNVPSRSPIDDGLQRSSKR